MVVLTLAMVPLCMGGAGFEGFLNMRERIFLMQCPGTVLLPTGWDFYTDAKILQSAPDFSQWI